MIISGDVLKIKNNGLGTIIIKEIRTYDDSNATLPISKKKFQEPGLQLQPLEESTHNPSEFSVASFSTMSVLAITDLGNIFSAINTDEFFENDARGTSDGKAMINGMGINSRIVTYEYGGKLTHGYGDSGVEDSLKTYNLFSSVHDFAAQLLSSDSQIIIPITKFNTQYRYSPQTQSLQAESAAAANVLGYSQSRIVGGVASVTAGTDGITITGSGYVILKLNNYETQSLVLEGNVPVNSQLVLSALREKDIFNTAYDDAKGFRIFDIANWSTSQTSYTALDCSKGASGWTATYLSTHVFSPPLLVSSQWSLSYGTPFVDGNPARLVSVSQTGSSFVPTAWCHPGQLAYYYSPQPSTVWDRDPLSWLDSIATFSSEFQTVYTFPSGQQLYLVAKPNGGTITIKGLTFNPSTPYLKITNLPSDIPYEIVKDGKLAVSGMASQTGTIDLLINDINIGGTAPRGTLYLYPNAMKYRGTFSTVVFDNINGQTIHTSTPEDKVYIVHAYVQIPVVGNVTVTDTHLGNMLQLSYLDGNYTTGNHIRVPVIPGYYDIHMKINGVPTKTVIADVLGATGLKVIPPSISTITRSDDNDLVSSIAATSGSVSYVIATMSGSITTSITATISGDSEIKNYAYFGAAPPAPPAPHPKDPLKAWVDVYKNGVLVMQQQIYFNSMPNPQNSGGVSGTSSYVIDKYTYPQTVIGGVVTTNVLPGDFVEFYLYANIEADGSAPPIPPDHVLYHYSGEGRATATIHSGSILSS
jgi:hypothetical protein